MKRILLAFMALVFVFNASAFGVKKIGNIDKKTVGYDVNPGSIGSVCNYKDKILSFLPPPGGNDIVSCPAVIYGTYDVSTEEMRFKVVSQDGFRRYDCEHRILYLAVCRAEHSKFNVTYLCDKNRLCVKVGG